MAWRYIFYIGIVACLHTLDEYECNESNILDRKRLQHGVTLSAKGAKLTVNRIQHGHNEQIVYFFPSMQHSTFKTRMQRFKEYMNNIGRSSSKTTESKTAAFKNIINVNTGKMLKSSEQMLLKRFKRMCERSHYVHGQGQCDFNLGGGFPGPGGWRGTGGQTATAGISLSYLLPANATNHLGVTSKASFKFDTMSKDETRSTRSTKAALVSSTLFFINMQTVTSTRKHTPMSKFTTEEQTTSSSLQTKLLSTPISLPSSSVNITTSSLSNDTSMPVYQVSVENMSTQRQIHDGQLKGISTTAPKMSGVQATSFTLIERSNSVTKFSIPSSATLKLIQKATSDFSPTDDSLQNPITSSSKHLSFQTNFISTGRVVTMTETGPNMESFYSRPAADPVEVSTTFDSNATEKHKYSTNMSIKKESTTLINNYSSPRFFESAANVAIVSTVATAVAFSTAFVLIWTFAPHSTKTGLLSDSMHDIERIDRSRHAANSPTTSDRISPSSTSTLIPNTDSNSSLTPVELYSVKGLDF